MAFLTSNGRANKEQYNKENKKIQMNTGIPNLHVSRVTL